MRNSSLTRIALCLSFLFVTASAQAGLEARWFLTFATPEGQVCHAYHLWVVSGALEPGASFSQHITFYDVQNLLPGSAGSTLPPDWTLSIQSRGVDASDVPMRGRDDSARLMNLTWTWNGTTRVEGPADLGTIRVCSIGAPDSGVGAPYHYVSQTSGAQGPTGLTAYTRGTRYP